MWLHLTYDKVCTVRLCENSDHYRPGTVVGIVDQQYELDEDIKTTKCYIKYYLKWHKHSLLLYKL